MSSLKEISLDGIKYIRADEVQQAAREKDGLEYKLIRCDRSGVFAGYLKSLEGQKAVILEARRIFYWSGAASLSQLSIDGTSKPNDCKFPEAVSEITVTDCIEIVSVTEKARKSIADVKVWRA